MIDVRGQSAKTLLETGGSILIISDDYNVQSKKDGSKTITMKLVLASIWIGNCSKIVLSKSRAHASGNAWVSPASFNDVIGNVTYRFKGTDGILIDPPLKTTSEYPRLRECSQAIRAFTRLQRTKVKVLMEAPSFMTSDPDPQLASVPRLMTFWGSRASPGLMDSIDWRPGTMTR